MTVPSLVGFAVLPSVDAPSAAQRTDAQLHQTALTANAGTETLDARMPPQID